jgi:arylamine N-acetyltransferase
MAYTREQIDQFLKHIGLPEELHHAEPSPSLLKALHIYTLSTLPYENLSLHYNPTHAIVLNPQHLFEKIVENKRGRGGYCMENAILYNHILRGLGFDVYTAGARTRTRVDGVPQGDFPGW